MCYSSRGGPTSVKATKVGYVDSPPSFELIRLLIGEEKVLDPYEKSLVMKEKLRQFLTDTERFPKALVFLGRNMRMVQGIEVFYISAHRCISNLPAVEVITKHWAPP